MSEASDGTRQRQLEAASAAFGRCDHDEEGRHLLAALEEVEGCGSDDPRLLPVLKQLVHFYACSQPDYQRLEQTAERLLRLQESLLGPQHVDLIPTLSELGLAYSINEKPVQAEQAYRRCVTLREGAQGTDHVEVAGALWNLGQFLRNEKRHAEAEVELRRAYQTVQHCQQAGADMGWHSPDAVPSLLAEVLSAQGKHAEAENVLRWLRAVEEQTDGRTHAAEFTRQKLAETCFALGKLDEAESLYRGVLESYERHRPKRPAIMRVMVAQRLAAVHRAQGKLSDAEAIYQRAIKALKQTLPEYRRRVPRESYARLAPTMRNGRDRHLIAIWRAYADLLRELHRESDATDLEARAARLERQFSRRPPLLPLGHTRDVPPASPGPDS